MKTSRVADKVAGISSAAVQAKTGRTWPEWFAVLDAAGARSMTHQEIVAVLHTQYGVGSWWQQMVTNGYEQARKGRAKHQMADGFQVSVSRTLAVPVAVLYQHWHAARSRARWLGVPGLTVTTATPAKSLRLKWPKDGGRVSVNFYAKGAGKSQVAVEHSQLKGARAAAQQKKFWAEALDRLQARLEKQIESG